MNEECGTECFEVVCKINYNILWTLVVGVQLHSDGKGTLCHQLYGRDRVEINW